MSKSNKDAGEAVTIKKLLALPGSVGGLLALALSLACAVGYGVTQITARSGYAGQVERQWRDSGPLVPGAGPSLMVSGEIKSQTVTDPGYQLTARGIYLSREVSFYQWSESCSKQGCKVELGWRSQWIDASKFKTQGYDNPKPELPPQQLPSLVLASRAGVGNGAVTARVASKLGSISKPYKMGADDMELPGWHKSSDGYQSFQGEPRAGAVKASFKTIANGTDLTVAGYPNRDGDIDLIKGSSDLLFKEGAMTADKLLGMQWWQLPRFGWVLLALSAALLAAGSYGLWTAREIERQIVEERRRRGAEARLREARNRGGAGRPSGQKKAAPEQKKPQEQK